MSNHLTNTSANTIASNQPTNKISVAESRRKAVERITEKKRSLQSKINRSTAEKQIEDNRFRLKWKTDMKGKRMVQLNNQVDAEVLKKVIKHEPNFLDFSKLEMLNPLEGLDLEPQEEPNYDVEPNPLDVMKIKTKHEKSGFLRNLDRDISRIADLVSNSEAAQEEKSDSQVNATGSALLNKFSRKVAKKSNPTTIEYSRNLSSPLESSDSLREANNPHLSEPLQGSLTGLSGKLILPDQTDRLVDNMFVVGPGLQDIDNAVVNYLASLGNDALSVTSDTNSRLAATTRAGILSPNDKMKRTQSGKKLIEARTEKLIPRLLYSFCGMDTEIEELCYPSKVEVSLSMKPSSGRRNSERRTELSGFSNSSFVFKLTGHTSSRFVICLPIRKYFIDDRGVEICTSYCVCVISRFAFFSYCTHILQQFVELGGLDFESPLEKQDVGFPVVSSLRFLNDLATKLYRVIVPLYPLMVKAEDGSEGYSRCLPSIEVQMAVKSAIPGAPSRKIDLVMRRDLQLRYFSNSAYNAAYNANHGTSGAGSSPVASYTALENNEKERDWEREESFHVLLWALPVLLRKMPLDQISLAIGCALIEMHVIVLSPDISVMSACLLAIVHLLRPLKWVGVVVVTLPESQSEYLDSPVPLIAGVQTLPPGFELSPGVVVFDCQENCVKFHPVDNVASHKFFLPQTNKLIHSLTSPAETIFRLSRRKSAANIRKRSNSVSNLDVNGVAAAAADDLEREKALLPLSVDMDPLSEKGQQLMSAVSVFSSTVAAHLQVLVNTAVQAAWVEKQSKYKKRELKLSPSGKLVGGAGSEKTTNAKLLNDILRTSSTSAMNARQAFAVRSLPASVATATATMRFNTKAWMTTMANIVGGGDGGADGTLSVASSTQDSKGSGVGSDSSESLPSIQKGAPFFPSKEIGETGMTFIKSLQGTQMFCIYCQNRRHRSKQLRDQLETNTVDSSLDDSDGDMPLNPNDVSLHSQEEKISAGPPAEALMSPLGSSKDLLSIKEHVLSPLTVEQPVDPLVTFFQIAMFGTAPMQQNTLQALILAYSHNESTLDPNSDGIMSLAPSTEAQPSVKSSVVDLEKDLYWCNGRCGGEANTETCTTLCLQLWEERVKLFTHHLAIKEIVERNHHSSLVLNPVRLHSGELKSIKPAIAPARHARETDTQYAQRVQLVERVRMEELQGSDTSDTEDFERKDAVEVPIDGRHTYTLLPDRIQPNRIDWSSPQSGAKFQSQRQAADRSEAKPSRKLHPDAVYWQSQGPRKKCTKYAGPNASPAVKSIARYYVRMQQNRIVIKVAKATRTIISFFYRAHFLLYYWRRQAAAIAIQALFRGRFIRGCMPTIIEELVAEKQHRNDCACLIQMWARDCIARQNAAREKLKTFRRLDSSRSPTIIPIASGESSLKSRSRSLWSPPAYIPQPPPGTTPPVSALTSPVLLPGDAYPEFPFVSTSSSYDFHESASTSSKQDSAVAMQRSAVPMHQSNIGSRPSIVADSILSKTKSKGFGSKAKIIFKGFLGKGAASVDKPVISEAPVVRTLNSAPAATLKSVATGAGLPFSSTSNGNAGQAMNIPNGGGIATGTDDTSNNALRTLSKFSVLSDEDSSAIGSANRHEISLTHPNSKKDVEDIPLSQQHRVANNISPAAIVPVPVKASGSVSPVKSAGFEPIPMSSTNREGKQVGSAGKSAFSETSPLQLKSVVDDSSNGGSVTTNPNSNSSTAPSNPGLLNSPTNDSDAAQGVDSDSRRKGGRNRVTIVDAATEDLDTNTSPSDSRKALVHGPIHAESSQIFDSEDAGPMLFSDFTFNSTGGLQLDASIPQPLHQLFISAGDAFTRQQRKIILDMYNILQNGVDVMKHGRGGKAHQRFLYCDDFLSVLFWRATQSTDGKKETDFHHSKHRRFSFWAGKQDDDRFIYIQDIICVTKILDSAIPSRRSSTSRATGAFLEARTPLSIQFPEMSLDLELFEKDWIFVFHGLEVMVDYYNRTRASDALQSSTKAGLASDDIRLNSAPNAATSGVGEQSKRASRRHSIL